jgi:tRNA G10  N-methylase Trm11
MDYMAGLPDKAFELAIVDPPYGIDSKMLRKGKTKRQNTFFKHYYDVAITGGFNVYAKQSVSLFADGVNLLDGYLQLLNVSIVNGVVSQYEVLIAGEVGAIARSLGEKELSELGLDALNHTYE